MADAALCRTGPDGKRTDPAQGVKGALRRAAPALDPLRRPKTPPNSPTRNLAEAEFIHFAFS
jgi:hypothetical protein